MGMYFTLIVQISVLISLSCLIKCQTILEEHFKNCHRSDPTFDECMKNALNDARYLFKTGVPEYGIDPFDPFHAEEVVHKRGGPLLNYKLKLKNVTESGWTISQITNFKSNLEKNMIQYTQFFPDKRLEGEYEFVGSLMGNQINNQGSWNLTLFDYIQTTTVTRKPRTTEDGRVVYDTPFKVNIRYQTVKNMELHISRLLGGRAIAENMLDRIINSAWQPGIIVLAPIINELVSSAFTEIFNKAFQYFPFEQVIPQ